MKAMTALKYAWRALLKKDDYARFFLAEKVASFIYPKLMLGEYGKILFDDEVFRDYYFSFEETGRSFDRKYFLKEIIKITMNVPGDTAECGVYKGASSRLICQSTKGRGKKHHLFDAFSGLSKPRAEDGGYWSEGDLVVGSQEAIDNLSDFDFVVLHQGWIPSRFEEVAHLTFSFVHIDVDLFEPTLESLRFFYGRLNGGGVIVCDDYGFSTCPGAKQAVDEFFCDKPEEIVQVPTGQAMVIKK